MAYIECTVASRTRNGKTLQWENSGPERFRLMDSKVYTSSSMCVSRDVYINLNMVRLDDVYRT